MSADNDTAHPGLLGRVFALERHEHVAVAWSFVYFFCVLSAYYILRPVRETMGVGSGPNTLPYLFVATFVVTLVVTPIFGWVTSRYPRKVFLPWVYLFFASNILIFWAVFSMRVDDGQDHIWLGRTFFVWLSVFNLFVVSVFWSFMADIYTREQGRRLFGLITSGGSIGALLGAGATSLLVTRIGNSNLFPIAAGLLLLAVVCIRQLRKWVTHEHQDELEKTAESGRPLGGDVLSGITHVFQSKFFTAITIASVIASLLGTALYYFRAELVAETILDEDARTQFFSNINFASSLIALVGQMFVVKHVVRRFGIGASLAVLPIISTVCFVWVAFDPTLLVIALADVARRGLGFSFAKPSTDMLYSVVTPEEKYKTKNFIDVSVYRFGDVVGIWAIRIMMVMGMSVVSLVMLPFAVIWTLIAFWLGRDYRRQARELKESGIA